MVVSLARALLGAGLADAVTLGQASAISAEGGVPLVFALVRWRLLEAGQVAQALAQALGVTVAALDELPALPVLPVPRSVCARMRFLPLWRRGEVVGLAMSDPTDDDAVDQVVGACRVAVERILVNDDDLERALRHVYPRADELLPVRRPEGPPARPVGIEQAALPRTASSTKTIAHVAAPLFPTAVPAGLSPSPAAVVAPALPSRLATPAPVLAPTRIVSSPLVPPAASSSARVGSASTSALASVFTSSVPVVAVPPRAPSSFAAPPHARDVAGHDAFRSSTPLSDVTAPITPQVAEVRRAPLVFDPARPIVVHGEHTGVAVVGGIPEASAEMFAVSVVEGVPLDSPSEVFGNATVDMNRPGATVAAASAPGAPPTRVGTVADAVEPSQEMTLPSDMLAVVKLLVVAQGPVVDVVRGGLRPRLRELVIVGRIDEAIVLVASRGFDEVIVVDPVDTVAGSQQLAILASRVRRGVLALGQNDDLARLPRVRFARYAAGDDLVGLIAERLQEAARS
jgi:hypothetical protein